MKLCVNCKHHYQWQPFRGPTQHSCGQRVRISPVTGEKVVTWQECWEARMCTGPCQAEGLLFEPKANVTESVDVAVLKTAG